MQQGALQFDEAELQGCQPGQMPWIHSQFQGLHGGLAELLTQRVSPPLTAIAAFGEQLIFPPAVDALRRQLSAAGIL
jgi:hypothetical protein